MLIAEHAFYGSIEPASRQRRMKIECSGVAKATRILLMQLVPALKGRAKLRSPLRGEMPIPGRPDFRGKAIVLSTLPDLKFPHLLKTPTHRGPPRLILHSRAPLQLFRARLSLPDQYGWDDSQSRLVRSQTCKRHQPDRPASHRDKPDILPAVPRRCPSPDLHRCPCRQKIARGPARRRLPSSRA